MNNIILQVGQIDKLLNLIKYENKMRDWTIEIYESPDNENKNGKNDCDNFTRAIFYSI